MGGYVPNTEKERQEMLQAAGYSDMDDLFADIPEEVRLKGELEIPAGMPELSVRRESVGVCSIVPFINDICA